jgi:hypothetical protein
VLILKVVSQGPMYARSEEGRWRVATLLLALTPNAIELVCLHG